LFSPLIISTVSFLGASGMTATEARRLASSATSSPLSVSANQQQFESLSATAAVGTLPPTMSPSASPTRSACPANYDARDDLVSGTAADSRSVNSEQECADLCNQRSPAYLGFGCLGFTASPGVTNEFGYTPINCILVNGNVSSNNGVAPCPLGSRCCTLSAVARPPTPPPTSRHCPAGYADYGSRFGRGLGRITIVTAHVQCAARCTHHSGVRYNGGCKGYMTGMYFGMVFCRSYGGDWSGAQACAPWASPSNQGLFSGAVGFVHPRTGQENIGGNCCTNITFVDAAL